MERDWNVFGDPLGEIEAEIDIIPLHNAGDEERFEKERIPDVLPILPLRNMVLYPGVVLPITVGRDKSINLIREANQGTKIIGVVAQRKDSVEDPLMEDLYLTGTVAQIIRVLKMPDGSTNIIIQGKRRFRISEIIQTSPYLKAKVEFVSDLRPPKDDKEFEAILSSIKEVSAEIIKKSPHIPSDAIIALNNMEGRSFIVNFVASNLNCSLEQKQELLEISNLKERSLKLLELLNKELQLLEIKNEIQNKTRQDIDKQQREYFLNQQMKAIQEELGGSAFEQEIKEFKEKAQKMNWPDHAKTAFEKNIQKLERMNPNAAEYSIQTNYIELLLELPWNNITEDNLDLDRARKILDEDHFGLEKVKDRIIEYLAVLKLKKSLKGSILCLCGPPGVGKTSLGKSIARALGRKYVRMSLGGLKDESEIRGHRKTYIGAMPGRIISNLKKAESSNPVFVLDEIDKIGNDFHGDPSSALLEVLDPEQNTAFHDNFLEIDYDLSKVMFIATCNQLNTIQPALRDRMEIIELSGYTVEEKMEIAKKHLIPKICEQTGISKQDLKISSKLLEHLIDNYTSESGVRNLERQLSKLARVVAVYKAQEKEPPEINEDFILKTLGPSHVKEKYEGNEIPGVVTGLAWTPTGGEILFVESSHYASKQPKLTLTGNLGDVMKESATIALEYLKQHPEIIRKNSAFFDEHSFHVHVPEGATPKDGPSAGIAMLTALASSITGKKVKKALAMSGEITLRGKVLPVGGIKEKILAAKRAGIKEIILSKENVKDVNEIPQNYIKGLKFVYVEKMNEVLKHALGI
ncbi:MAG: endopeptidase La [Bacteroidia bacterium]|nr:endopeptidase La [Bacteroidia bacterium]